MINWKLNGRNWTRHKYVKICHNRSLPKYISYHVANEENHVKLKGILSSGQEPELNSQTRSRSTDLYLRVTKLEKRRCNARKEEKLVDVWFSI
jgi:hypothetical protein